MKVLVVDDEEDIRQIASLSLTRLGGMDVLNAASGSEGVTEAETGHPDVILLDVMMPGMDGPATFAALRRNPRTAAIPVIFLTAATTPDDLARLRGLGAAAVLPKPFDPVELPQLVRSVLPGK